MLTFLFRAVSPSVAMTLCMAYYRCNAELFTDEEEQHRKEAESHLRATEERWRAGLNAEESEHYHDLSIQEDLAVTFRICRDLAQHNDNQGQFPLSYNDLALRLDTTTPKASRYLRLMQGCGMLQIVSKGQRYRKGEKPLATVWRWLLPSHNPPPPPSA
jgi:hypothetical protein